MITRFEQMKDVKLARPAVLAVAAAEDEPVIEAVLQAKKLGLVTPILFGDEAKIRALLGDIQDIEIVGEVETRYMMFQFRGEMSVTLVVHPVLFHKTFCSKLQFVEVGETFSPFGFHMKLRFQLFQQVVR